jgi:hypothetical protein
MAKANVSTAIKSVNSTPATFHAITAVSPMKIAS